MFLGSGKKDITTNRTKRRNQVKKGGMQSWINFNIMRTFFVFEINDIKFKSVRSKLWRLHSKNNEMFSEIKDLPSESAVKSRRFINPYVHMYS